MSVKKQNRRNERGSAGVKFVITLAVIVLTAHAGYNYVPVAYSAESVKSEMTTAVLQGLALPGKVNPVENVKTRIERSLVQNNVSIVEAFVDVKQNANSITAHVSYTKQISLLPFGIYTYAYHFDHTATPSGFLMKQ